MLVGTVTRGSFFVICSENNTEFHAVTAYFLHLFTQGVIRFLKIRQSWSNLWADLVINLMRYQSYDEDGET